VTVYPGLLGFRDVGGLRAEDGGRVRRGVLFRSGTPQFLDLPTARNLLDGTGIRSTIDLRLAHETAREGRGPLDELGLRHVPHPFTIRGLVAEDSAVAPMHGDDPLVATYLGYLVEDAAGVLSLLPKLLEPDTLPVLVHCTVGKDRTGVAIALVLAAIGVRREDIVADYAVSQGDVVAAMDRLRTMPSYAAAVDVYPSAAWDAPPDVMTRFLDGVDRQFGGIGALLRDNGITDDTVTALKDLLITHDAEELP
jgi:protein-tyrosine phosphatase